MKTFLKWAGIVLAVLLAVFVLVMPFMGRFAYGFNRRMPMMGGGNYHDFPMMGHGGMGFSGMGFGGMGIWMVLRGLFSLAVLALIVWGIVLLVRHLSRPAAAVPAAVVPAPVVVKTCLACGQVLDAAWTHCPHCGEKVENS